VIASGASGHLVILPVIGGLHCSDWPNQGAFGGGQFIPPVFGGSVAASWA
jgi:hypothetical protein